MNSSIEKREALLSRTKSYGRCLAAFSGGVDSCVVAKAAQLSLGDNAAAVIGVSHSLAEGELEQARRVAALIGIRLIEIQTDEFSNRDYTRNAPDRCYHCKTELYTHLSRLAEQMNVAVIANGANVDDLGDYRPGLQAAREHRVDSPLAACGFTKNDVRRLAKEWELPVWDKPAMPCLSSRVAYGEEVTPQRLHMIDQAEQHLRRLGLKNVRVRFHQGDMARIEAPLQDLPRLCEPTTRAELVDVLRALGFQWITLDLQGFRSGNLNALVPLEAAFPGDQPL